MDSNASSPGSSMAVKVENMKIESDVGVDDEVVKYDSCLVTEDDPNGRGVTYSVLGSSFRQSNVFHKDTTLKEFYDFVMSDNGKSGDELSLHLSNQAILMDSPEMSKTLEDLKVTPETIISFDAKTSGGSFDAKTSGSASSKICTIG